MLEPKFSLKRPKSETKTRIVMRVHYGSTSPIKTYLPISIVPENWDSNLKQAKRKEKNAIVINNYLDGMKTLVRSYANRMLTEKKPVTKEGLKSVIENYVNRVDKGEPEKITLLSYIDTFINDSKSRVSAGRIKRYNVFKNNFIKFCTYQKFNYDFDDITYDFYNAFTSYFFEVRKQAPNTLSGTIAILKKIMKESRRSRLHTNRDYEDFEKTSNEVKRVFLSVEEIDKIYNKKMPNNYLEKAKHIFIFGCLTGLRYADFSDIKQHNIIEEDGVFYLRKITEKTKKEVEIPIKKLAHEILKKYDFNLPSISNQKLNVYVKELCEICEIDDDVLKPYYKGNKHTVEIKKKYELISSHTARRSFATNAYLQGVPTIFIMQMTGHTTESSFMKYICITQKESARLMSKHDFFKS